MGGGGFTITGTEADIRATLDSFTFTPAANDDSNVTLGVAVTATDSNGDTATTSSAHTLNVAAIADAPVGSGTGTGNEDRAIAVPVSVGVSDTDGSETITQVMIEAPAGVVLGGFGPSGASVNQAGQTWTLTGTQAQIEAALAAMTATPPLHSDVDFDLTVTITASETMPNGGEVTTLSADTVITVPVIVNAVADAPTVSVGSGVFNTDEDTVVSLSGLSGSLVDTDGSEALSYEISGIPLGAALNGGTDLGAGVWSFTPAELAVLTFTPPTNWHAINLTLTAIATEGNGNDQASNALPFQIVVEAQADAPTVTPGASTTNEDTAAQVGTAISYGLLDTTARK
ncbi:MAG: hypothetical protein U5K75_11785 [Ahrensia sp.]|nr:hypothetical protein [Ahrensia sp.]